MVWTRGVAKVTDEARTASIWINRPYEEVYGFVEKPENFPKWATGLGEAIAHDGEVWRFKTPDGDAKVRFTASNEYGVADHHVLLDDGTEIHVPMRVIRNGEGAEVMLTVCRRSRPDKEMKADVEWVEHDLIALKELIG
jgi:uncharacterized protein YndB with AHSA1/START domain